MTVDHDPVGLGLYFHFTRTARSSHRPDVAAEAMALPQVVEVIELMTGQETLHIETVDAEDEDITAVAEPLDGLSLEINDENHVEVMTLVDEKAE